MWLAINRIDTVYIGSDSIKISPSTHQGKEKVTILFSIPCIMKILFVALKKPEELSKNAQQTMKKYEESAQNRTTNARIVLSSWQKNTLID